MNKAPLKGMKDFLPEEMRVRDYVQGKILEIYRASGFERISTPILEDMENLDKSDGGDNLNLIFKVLKRGEKLEKALAGGDAKALCDMGLRYDLTLPLSRSSTVRCIFTLRMPMVVVSAKMISSMRSLSFGSQITLSCHAGLFFFMKTGA